MSSNETTAAPLSFGGQSLAPAFNDQRHLVRERRRRLVRAIRQGLLVAALLAAAAGAALALRPRPVPVDAGRADRGPLAVDIEETGVARVKDRYLISAPVTGSISRVPLEPGDTVKEGDALVEIAPALSPLLDERARAQAEARLAAALSALGQTDAQVQRAAVARQQTAAELERQRVLAAAGTITRQALEQAEFADRMKGEELASAQFAAKVATEEVRVARLTLGRPSMADGRHIRVAAPVAGQVLRVHHKSAGLVQAGAPLLEIGDPAALEVVVDLLTTDAVNVGPGTPVTIQGWGGGHPLAARVRRLEPSAFTRPSALGVDEQRVNVIVALDEPRARWAALSDGYRVEARLSLWQASDVLAVPQGAVFRRGDGWAVFRVDGGVAHLQPVDIGHRGERAVEVLAGLPPGATVAVHPGDRVKDGARVEPR
jgi:HlyD family secretion protein